MDAKILLRFTGPGQYIYISNGRSYLESYLERVLGREPPGSYIAPQSVVLAVILIFCFEIVYC